MNASAHDRRNSPRYSTQGSVTFTPLGQSSVSAELLDLSMNGAQLKLANADNVAVGSVVDVQLSLDGTPQVKARAKVAYLGGARCGVEFADMDSHDFDVFAALVLMLEHRQRSQALSG
jgi:c-di-GMP-binding flagellar brake protein YcgR